MIKEYLYKIERYIYKSVAKELNTAYGLTKTAPLASGVFLKLPIQIRLVKLPKVNYSSIMTSFTAYTKIGNETEVFFDFFYNDSKELPKLFKLIEANSTFFFYVYQHEILHILLKHVTTPFQKRMLRIVKEIKPDMDEHTAHSFINNAEDYFINYSIKDLTESSSQGISTLLEKGLYDANYHNNKLSDIQILEDLLKTSKVETSPIGDTGYELQKTTDGKGNVTIQVNNIDANQPGNGSSEGEGQSDSQLADLAQSINSTIQSQAKGSQAAAITEDLFNSIQVNTNWFKKLKTTFERDVYYMTHNYYTKWSNLNNKYRSIFKSPKKYYLDSKLEIVLSIDQSGSMPQNSLQKLLYLMEDKGSSISKLTVLIHDCEISKEFILESDYGIDTNPNFKAALATRYQSGGTAHTCIFSKLQETVKNPQETIYISFSDNYSTIKEDWCKFPIMKKIKTYLVCPVNNPMDIAGAVDILME